MGRGRDSGLERRGGEGGNLLEGEEIEGSSSLVTALLPSPPSAPVRSLCSSNPTVMSALRPFRAEAVCSL